MVHNKCTPHLLNDINLMDFAMKTIELVVSTEDDSIKLLTGTVNKIIYLLNLMMHSIIII